MSKVRNIPADLRAELFATCLPGLGPVLVGELEQMAGTRRVEMTGNDGRCDVVRFCIDDPSAALKLRCAEDVYALVAAVAKARDLRQLGHRLITVVGIDQAELVHTRATGHTLRRRSTARVIARVTDERNFRRTDLRFAATNELSKARGQWQSADPAEAELWVLQVGASAFISGLRVTTTRFRQHGGKAQERRASLRPSVAGALVQLAGQPMRGPLLDLCCGSGTICAEAAIRGWQVAGGDIDPDAVAIARKNFPDPSFFVADCRSLPIADASIGAVVANLPFGHEFSVQGDRRSWLKAVLREIKRVQVAGAAAILLVPRSADLSSACATSGLQHNRSLDITLLGMRTTIWCFGSQTDTAAQSNVPSDTPAERL